MRIIKVLTLAAMGIMGISAANAQDKVEGSVSADVVSRYVWRGQALGDAAIQPSAGLSYKGFSLSAWGSYGFLNTQDAKEFDLTLAYTKGGFNVGVTDYWFSYYGEDNKYFEYRAHDTKHVWEANIGYDFGPLAIQWYTNFAGADGCNKSGDRAYSSYVQLSAPFTLASCDWTATVGAVPYINGLLCRRHRRLQRDQHITPRDEDHTRMQVLGHPGVYGRLMQSEHEERLSRCRFHCCAII